MDRVDAAMEGIEGLRRYRHWSFAVRRLERRTGCSAFLTWVIIFCFKRDGGDVRL